MILTELVDKKQLTPPKWLANNCQWIVMTGSHAYGCETAESDHDYMGYAMPPKHILFPFSVGGMIYGFDNNFEKFEEYRETSKPEDVKSVKKADTSDWVIFSIVKMFNLLKNNNPTCLDVLFVPRRCVVHSTKIGEMVHERRHIFLSKKLYHTHKGYAYEMLHKSDGKKPKEGSNRAKLREQYGFDTKYLYNVVRLISQCEMYLQTGDCDLERDREIYKAIRRGEWTVDQIKGHFKEKEKYLEKLYQENDTLPYTPKDDEIRQLLLDCIEQHYGDISKCVTVLGKESLAIQKIKEIISNF